MEEVFVLDKNLNVIHIIDVYESLIWCNRYNDVGDCELVIKASSENVKRIKGGLYLAREDDDMVCRVKKINIQTDKENGDNLIISGYDIKDILRQRIIWKKTNVNGLVEDYIRKLINDSIINPIMQNRKIDNFILDDKANFTETTTEQVTYDNLETKIQEICKKYDWGYKVYIKNNKFVFKLYKGEDKSNYVTFSDEYENLASNEYNEDNTSIANVGLIAGEGEDEKRTIATIGDEKGLDRYEMYIDARDISSSIEFEELISMYPNGKEVKSGNIIYYQVNNKNVAAITKDNEGNIETVSLIKDVYMDLLKNRGIENMSDYVSIKSFEGSIIPNYTFEYKKDYFLGDIVNVENSLGISLNARIVEIIEVHDSNGYSIEPKFEYLEKGE